MVKNPPANEETQETWVRSLGQKNSLEEEMETYSSILAWKIPWTEEPGGLHTVHRMEKSQTQLSACAHTHAHTEFVCTCITLLYT